MVAAVWLAAAVSSRSSSAGSMRPRSITPSSENNPRSEAARAAIGCRAADPHGGSRRPALDRLGGNREPSNQRERRTDNAARNAAPAAIGAGMNSAHTGVLHDASNAVTSTQNTQETV